MEQDAPALDAGTTEQPAIVEQDLSPAFEEEQPPDAEVEPRLEPWERLLREIAAQ